MPIPSRPLEEIGKLANDFLAGQIFIDRQIPPECGLRFEEIFMPLMFLEQAQLDEFRAEPPGMFYEHISEASPRTVNGYPVFMTVKTINKEDFAKFIEIVKAL